MENDNAIDNALAQILQNMTLQISTMKTLLTKKQTGDSSKQQEENIEKGVDELLNGVKNNMWSGSNGERKMSDHNNLHISRIKIESETKNDRHNVFKIVLTGGPCAGKTTAMTKLGDSLRERGYKVFSVPEAASLIYNSAFGDLDFPKFTEEMTLKFQFFLMMIQITLEDSLIGIAKSITKNKKIVILCDRGTMDGSAYMEKKLWEQLINDNDLNIERIRDKRYDLVIHITTAADGAESFYTNQNNVARKENVEFARILDKRLEEAWIDHPNFAQINNQFSNFNDKMNSVVMTVHKFLGIDSGIDFYNKYLVANPNGNLIDLIKEKFQIKIHSCTITDLLFFKDESKTELTYFRKRVL